MEKRRVAESICAAGNEWYSVSREKRPMPKTFESPQKVGVAPAHIYNCKSVFDEAINFLGRPAKDPFNSADILRMAATEFAEIFYFVSTSFSTLSYLSPSLTNSATKVIK